MFFVEPPCSLVNTQEELTRATVAKFNVGKQLTLDNKQNKRSEEQRDPIKRCMLSLSGLLAPF